MALLKLYSVLLTPDMSSVADKVTVTLDVNQPLFPSMPLGLMVVVGGVKSRGVTVTFFVSLSACHVFSSPSQLALISYVPVAVVSHVYV